MRSETKGGVRCKFRGPSQHVFVTCCSLFANSVLLLAKTTRTSIQFPIRVEKKCACRRDQTCWRKNRARKKPSCIRHATTICGCCECPLTAKYCRRVQRTKTLLVQYLVPRADALAPATSKPYLHTAARCTHTYDNKREPPLAYHKRTLKTCTGRRAARKEIRNGTNAFARPRLLQKTSLLRAATVTAAATGIRPP